MTFIMENTVVDISELKTMFKFIPFKNIKCPLNTVKKIN